VDNTAFNSFERTGKTTPCSIAGEQVTKEQHQKKLQSRFCTLLYEDIMDNADLRIYRLNLMKEISFYRVVALSPNK
jgi:hypothetical protein